MGVSSDLVLNILLRKKGRKARGRRDWRSRWGRITANTDSCLKELGFFL